MVSLNEGKALIKGLQELKPKGYRSTHFLQEFLTKNWTEDELDYLMMKIDINSCTESMSHSRSGPVFSCTIRFSCMKFDA